MSAGFQTVVGHAEGPVDLAPIGLEGAPIGCTLVESIAPGGEFGAQGTERAQGGIGHRVPGQVATDYLVIIRCVRYKPEQSDEVVGGWVGIIASAIEQSGFAELDKRI